MPPNEQILSADAWRRDTRSLKRVGRRMWLSSLAALVLAAAVVIPVASSAEPAAAHTQWNCWDERVERDTGGTVTWTETVRRCETVEHTHEYHWSRETFGPFWYAACGPLWWLCTFTNENDGH